ncbi:MAG TPA: SPOR domain-containing protein [Allosphingosinicella sp.]|nr:SPOR domain-containing protein [Allosphingosinicella sp.]
MFSAAPASAQTGTATGVFTERPQAALSRNLRSLAANPKSVTALMGAGKAALDLGDPQAALTFFARAEEQMPRDGRVKMWIASALTQLQQPHAALKFFRDASDLGVPAAEMARDRGLAHDIAGNPREAQRDYRLALLKGRDDEVTRRLALSLAISGEREPALRLLEDQLLVRDRAAERARALILALTGDSTGAARAVEAAMPGQAGAMSPFLARLPSLAPAERALAVHLGVFPKDGRTAAPSTYAANDFANAVTSAGRPDPSQNSLGRRTPPPEPVSTAPRRRPGGEGDLAPAVRRPDRRPATATPGADQALAGVRSRPAAPAAKPDREERLADARPRSTTRRSSSSPSFGGRNPAWAWSRGLVPDQPRRRAEPKPKPAQTPPARSEAPAETLAAAAAPSVPAIIAQAPPAAAPAPEPASTPPPPQIDFQLQPQPETQAPSQPELQPQPQPAEVRIASAEPSAPPPQAEVRIASAEPTTPPPQAEVRIAAAEPSAPPPQAEAVPSGSRLADLSATIAEIAEPAPAPARADPPKPKPAARASAAPAKKPKAATADPSRVWVQVAGGADKGALPREFARLKAKAPKLLGGRGAWTAPLNATNRLLVGPFASAKEAQAFVNQLKAEDLSGFAWTSPAGQKVEKLPAK